MKKTLALVALTLILVVAFAAPALAVKPTLNLAAAKVVPWNLSSAVMPVPPYGSMDIPGSDVASKLIVNQPNGNTEVAITGVMGGLTPMTTYTAYLSNGYTPYKDMGWNVTGTYVIDLTYLGIHYTEYLVLTQSGDLVIGDWVATSADGTANRFDIESGAVVGDQLTFRGKNGSLETDFTATIAPDGSLMDGAWQDVVNGSRTGTWSSTAGNAAKVSSGDKGWPGLFTSTVPAFTFATDALGAASWHVNLKDANFPGVGTYPLSVWINVGGTILISDTFTVVK